MRLRDTEIDQKKEKERETILRHKIFLLKQSITGIEFALPMANLHSNCSILDDP